MFSLTTCDQMVISRLDTEKSLELSQYITDLAVSINDDGVRNLEDKGFEQIDINLNEGVTGNFIYLWYKTGNEAPITRIQFSFTDDMVEGLTSAGFTKIDKNLNAGLSSSNSIYL